IPNPCVLWIAQPSPRTWLGIRRAPHHHLMGRLLLCPTVFAFRSLAPSRRGVPRSNANQNVNGDGAEWARADVSRLARQRLSALWWVWVDQVEGIDIPMTKDDLADEWALHSRMRNRL